ncbi:hypothetical protein BD410DRAFT_725354 [Rickenella mellea]|uniref:SNF2 family DNA-dependent ATPase domain-containing protein n=1 Tax=Rickenella mellea TaxID=50990 RepID=A0A4Y7Q1F0_9AGAM|nr:hypothetical protein BD410DRAFT_725354 [Rickenella mellea]
MPQPFRPSNGNIHNNYPKVIANTTIPGGFTKPSTVINAPTNPPYTKPKPTDGNPLWETFDEPADLGLYDPRKSAADAEKDLKDLLQDSMNDVAFEGVDMSLAHVQGFREGITLMPHQIVGRVWMKDRETGKKNGGILADDMGLGKTIQTLVRISDGRPRKSDKDSGFAAATLVVCPVALVSQWASEIKKMVVGMRVIEHHGPSRTWDPQELSRAHIVVTSYSIVGSEYASYSGDAKDKSKPKASSKASTSKSKSTGNSSESEFEAGSDDDSDSDRETFGRTLAKHKKAAPKSKKKALDALFRVKWWRIVLDEAHNIKNRKTKTAIACVALEGKFRWCLTGTPMQNNVEELFSLLQFLRIRPLNDWETFNHQINKPVKSGRSVRAMKRLQLVLKAIMLRRKKDTLLNGKPLIELPPRIVNVQPCEFDEDEREFYDALEKKIALTINKFMKGGAQMPNYTSMLVLLLRLRQACNHPSLVSKDFSTDKEAVEPKAAKNDGDLDGADDLADLFGQMGVAGERKCQMCQEILSEEEAHNPDATHCAGCADIAAKSRRRSLARPGIDLPPDSAKIRMILQLLEDIDERSDGEEKTIIFSQFTSMLDLLQPFLRANGVRYVRYDGSMRKDQREASLETIRTSGSVKCILISFKAGSTGLNLTACNNVILVDLWWNPALEDQAFDRTHRFGQTRQVNIFKLTIPNTVEERILKLQEDKRALANAALSGDKLTKSKNLGINDLMALFKGHGGGDDDEE